MTRGTSDSTVTEVTPNTDSRFSRVIPNSTMTRVTPDSTVTRVTPDCIVTRVTHDTYSD